MFSLFAEGALKIQIIWSNPNGAKASKQCPLAQAPPTTGTVAISNGQLYAFVAGIAHTKPTSIQFATFFSRCTCSFQKTTYICTMIQIQHTHFSFSRWYTSAGMSMY
jgi:hypothetical protein